MGMWDESCLSGRAVTGQAGWDVGIMPRSIAYSDPAQCMSATQGTTAAASQSEATLTQSCSTSLSSSHHNKYPRYPVS
ncbi:hypothetical protein CDV31_014359 [Fusarium ambrosium]|uniref:Uncharacterized protein n=1 Tax=Fusarium ambrosium TaxID=131363 RepID=A0A428SX15_9HYPO|nr:hypothetical protein CDV31_014359 [Fusarium ambrosium]